MSLPVGLKAKVRASVGARPSPTRSTARARARTIALAGVAIAAVLFFATGGVAHGAGRTIGVAAASIGGWSVIAGASVWAANRRGGSATGPSRAWLLSVAIGTPVLLSVLMLTIAVVAPAGNEIHPERLGLDCLVLTLSATLFPFVGLLLLRRGSDAVHPGAAAAALGAASTAAGGVMVELWCPVAAWKHVALGHVLPIVVLALVGAVAGGKVLRVRWRR
ncbi:MAG TPA: NrsF family protein [Polyangiaceae bacterium]|jgi:hypothetical protein